MQKQRCWAWPRPKYILAWDLTPKPSLHDVILFNGNVQIFCIGQKIK